MFKLGEHHNLSWDFIKVYISRFHPPLLIRISRNVVKESVLLKYFLRLFWRWARCGNHGCTEWGVMLLGCKVLHNLIFFLSLLNSLSPALSSHTVLLIFPWRCHCFHAWSISLESPIYHPSLTENPPFILQASVPMLPLLQCLLYSLGKVGCFFFLDFQKQFGLTWTNDTCCGVFSVCSCMCLLTTMLS